MKNFDVITIDGPASSGKSTIGLLFSQKIEYQFVDSGAIYRAGTLAVLEQKISLSDNEKITEIFKEMEVKFKMEEDKPQVYIYGKNVTSKLSDKKVTEAVPIVAAVKEAREVVKNIQQELAQIQNVVIAGRDIGSEIFPAAKLKFYITAGPEVRARRRFEQLVKKSEAVTLRQVLEEIKDRDHKDSTREASPLRIPKNAVVIDNSRMNIEQTVDKMLGYYHSEQENVKSDIVSQDCLC